MPENFSDGKSSQNLKILNLYAGIGGNRKLWDEVANIEVTAVEIEEEIAEVYHDFFPNDEVVIADAHKFLKENYKGYDFIWSSPPCPTHSKMKPVMVKSECKRTGNKGRKVEYPDMDLYQEIILLKHFFEGKWCVENVNSYYNPLIKPQTLQRHYIWANFPVFDIELKRGNIVKKHTKDVAEYYGMPNLSNYDISQRKDQILRNCVHPKLGKHILECSVGEKKNRLEAFC